MRPEMPQRILEKSKGGVKLTVDTQVYPLSTVYAAGYVFLDRAYIYLDKDSKEKINIWLFAKNKQENLDAIGMDFYNELLNYAHYFDSLKANADIMKTLMQRALFSAAPSLVEDAGKKEVEDVIEGLKEEKKIK